jgi:hypothetical protein
VAVKTVFLRNQNSVSVAPGIETLARRHASVNFSVIAGCSQAMQAMACTDDLKVNKRFYDLSRKDI